MKSNVKPLLIESMYFQICRAFLKGGDTGIGACPFDAWSLTDRVERKGLANGATYAAYVRFPTSFSNCLNGTKVDFKILSMRCKYFCCFFFDKLQDFVTEL